MIISEQQIIGLMSYMQGYINLMEDLKKIGYLTEMGQKNLENVREYLEMIANQQSTELKEIKQAHNLSIVDRLGAFVEVSII